MIGRRVSPHWVAEVLDDERPVIAIDEAWSAVLARGATLQLEGAMTIRRSLVMGVQRVELTGFSDAMVERLKAMGLISEIIAWKLRLFVPVGADGPVVLSRLLDRHPLQRVIDRAAA